MSTILTDGNKTAEIIMHTWDGTQYGPDFSDDFFIVGGLPETFIFDRVAYMVDDVEYCIEQARDWEAKRGDYFYDSEDMAAQHRDVIITYLD